MIKFIKTLSIICLTFICLTAFAQKPKWEKSFFHVSGKCEMCKTKIEASAKRIDGVKTARWNIVNGKMKVKFNPEITNTDKIQKTIASIGYDTEKHKATDEAYNNLHYCCKYEREQ
ncbi:MAG: heavy-metal-associated domain-containing protein [Flavobacteriales bacterium]|jgi:periplasmic mercuric ion binding protein|nr:heavy-metal-associated domain-containing protein [Flavobacteriales bacterium]MBT5750768.1 heavy-metal-associated domain-containing protein [Flavobacteriales bacterium]